MKAEIASQIGPVIAAHDPAAPRDAADALRGLWLQFEPKSVAGIKAELREQQETAGTPVPVLRSIGKGVGRVARKRVNDFIPLVRLLPDAIQGDASLFARADEFLAQDGRG